jgi:hypothetical protein
MNPHAILALAHVAWRHEARFRPVLCDRHRDELEQEAVLAILLENTSDARAARLAGRRAINRYLRRVNAQEQAEYMFALDHARRARKQGRESNTVEFRDVRTLCFEILARGQDRHKARDQDVFRLWLDRGMTPYEIATHLYPEVRHRYTALLSLYRAINKLRAVIQGALAPESHPLGDRYQT